MDLDQLNLILGLCAVLFFAGTDASKNGQGYEASSESMSLLNWSAIVAGLCLAVLSVFAMACCGFLKRRSKANDDPETMAETGNALNASAGNDIRMSQQSRPMTDVAAKPMQTTSFNLQSEVVRVGPIESNGPQRANAGAVALVAPQETHEFKDRSNSMASLRTIGNQGVEAVTLFSKDNNGIGLTVDGGTDDGIFVRDVQPDGPAGESRRLNSGDRIVSMAICMEKMTLDHAQTLFQLAKFYPVELHFVKGPPEVVLHPPSSGIVESPADLLEERGRSYSAGYLPSAAGDDHEVKLDQDRPSSSLTHLPPPGQISRWRNEAELSPEIKVQNDGLTFEEDIHTMSELASAQISGDRDDEELATIEAKNPVHLSVGGKHPGESQPPVAVAGFFAHYETPDENSQNQRANAAASHVDSEEEEDADRVNRVVSGKVMINKVRQPRVLDADEFGAQSGEDSLAAPTWQSDFKIDLPHLDAGSSEVAAVHGDGDFEGDWKLRNAVDADRNEQKKEGQEATEVGLDLNYSGGWDRNAVEAARLAEEMGTTKTHQNNRGIFKTGKDGYGRDSSTHWNSSYDAEYDEDQNSVSKARTSEGISWNANSPDLSSEMERDAEVIGTSNPLHTKINVDRRALSFGVKAERDKESYNDQGHEATEEETSDDGDVKVIQRGFVVDVGSRGKPDLLDPSEYFGSPAHGHNISAAGYDDTQPSESLSISGSQGLRRSPAGEAEEEVKVVRKGQTESYYQRFCETVETGLPGGEIDLDVVDEGHENEEEEEEGERKGKETQLRSEVKKYEERDLELEGSALKPVRGSNYQESNSVLQISGNVSPEIAMSDSRKQSPPHTKEVKGKSNMSIGGRLKEFFSPKKGSKDKDRGDNEETSVHAVDFTYSPVQLPGPRTSTEADARISPTDGAPRSLEERNSTGFEASITGAPPQGEPGVVLSNGGQDGKQGQIDEEVEETWASSYSVSGGGVLSATANTARRALEFSPLGKGRVDEDTSRTEEEDLDENSEWQRDARENDYDYPRKLYTTEMENEEGSAHRVQNGTGKSPTESDVPGFVFDGKDFNEFYYGMAFYGKDRIAADGVQEEAEDLEYEQTGYRVPPVGTESEKRVNGVDGYAMSEEQSLTIQLPQQLSSDDEDEIISYSSNAQTRFPADDSPPQERIAEYEKEKSDREKAAALSTSNRSDSFEFLDLNQFSLEPLELPSWESLGLSSQQNGFEGPSSSSYGSNATKYKTKEINLKTSEDRNNNTLIDSSNA